MRIYTCIYKKDGKIKARDFTGPFDCKKAEEVASDTLGLCENRDRIYALVPGQHANRVWIIDCEKTDASNKPEVEYKKQTPHESGICLKDYVPNGF
jgi:hypothetical protein